MIRKLLLLMLISGFMVNYINAAAYKNIDPQVVSFLEQLAKKDGPPIFKLKPEEARKILNDLQAPLVGKIPATVKDIMVPFKDHDDVSVRIVKPIGSKSNLPVVIYVHGGGWILGNKETHDYLIRKIANVAKVAVVFVNYTPSPEAQYPVAIEQVYAVANYIAKNGNKFGLDGKRMVIAGDSVGGNMANVVAQMAKDRGGPHFIKQILLYPVTDANFNTESYKQFGDGSLWLSKGAMEWFWDAYLPDVKKRSEPYASPLQATIDQLRGLPPAVVITNENDVLRDEGEALAHKMEKAGVPVRAVRILGTVHDSAMLAPLKDTQPTQEIIDIVIQALIQAFKR